MALRVRFSLRMLAIGIALVAILLGLVIRDYGSPRDVLIRDIRNHPRLVVFWRGKIGINSLSQTDNGLNAYMIDGPNKDMFVRQVASSVKMDYVDGLAVITAWIHVYALSKDNTVVARYSMRYDYYQDGRGVAMEELGEIASRGERITEDRLKEIESQIALKSRPESFLLGKCVFVLPLVPAEEDPIVK